MILGMHASPREQMSFFKSAHMHIRQADEPVMQEMKKMY